ncbi:MAG: hypothetical protein PHV07_04275 [Oscillospiraceae bacterium]|nr:hypothetical protein [Oscillospiraceae bacterium]
MSVGENNAERIWFFIPTQYDRHNLSDYICQLNIVNSDGEGDVVTADLTQNNDRPNHFEFYYDIPNKFTAKSGELSFWLKFLDGDNNVIINTVGEAKIPVYERKGIEESIPEHELSLLDEWTLKMEENNRISEDYYNQSKEEADKSQTSSIAAESFARGGTNTRLDEDIDNAKYYKEQAHGFRNESEGYKGQAADSAYNAQQSEVNSSNSEINAEESKNTAVQAKVSAKQSELNAGKSEIEAKKSETNAAESEDNAKQSEIKSAESEYNARQSEINAFEVEISVKQSEINISETEIRVGQISVFVEDKADEIIEIEENVVLLASQVQTLAHDVESDRIEVEDYRDEVEEFRDESKEYAESIYLWQQAPNLETMNNAIILHPPVLATI